MYHESSESPGSLMWLRCDASDAASAARAGNRAIGEAAGHRIWGKSLGVRLLENVEDAGYIGGC